MLHIITLEQSLLSPMRGVILISQIVSVLLVLEHLRPPLTKWTAQPVQILRYY